MGFKRYLARNFIPGKAQWDLIKNIKENGLVNGYKKTFHENLYEDDLLISPIYKHGKTAGKKEGYIQASKEYEHKLIEQAELFISQKKSFEKERDEYEKLLDDYDKLIDELESNLERSESENKLLQILLINERKLKNLMN